ncbi:acyl-[acyl-carrier-protein] thioesterase [Vallitalea guaymasensis]|uniref:acyl-[acyl-carrier-protein] thioesterase n=1 Tax=Vallitalea guaymasensis TaxID=1185412 RepID=UPI002353096E|nr:acyl-ACP thioesterase domain-containing protein [Vallitalea guaymasensis]
MSKIGTESYRLGTYAVDFENRIKMSTIFNYMQECAINHAHSQSYGVKEMTEEGLFWILSRAYIDVLEYPKLGDTITVKTWTKGTDKIFVLRDFKVYSSDRVIANVTTNWVIVDWKKMRPQRPKILNGTIDNLEDEYAVKEVPGKIFDVDNKEHVFDKNISYCDIDINHHVNNVRYVEMVLDSFCEDYYLKRQPKILHINFLNQCKYGQTIELHKGYNKETDNYYVEGVDKDSRKKYFQALIKWTNKK